MNIDFRQIYVWRGETGRRHYLFWGCALFGIKSVLDRFLPNLLGQAETPINPPFSLVYGALPNFDEITRPGYFLILLYIALPFIYMGVCLTVKRLRSAGLHPGLAALFFVPYVNLMFFVVLCCLEPKRGERSQPRAGGSPSRLLHLIPRRKLAGALFGWLISVLVCLIISLFTIYWLGQYGWPLFVGVPFFGGLLACVLFGFHEPRSFRNVWRWPPCPGLCWVWGSSRSPSRA